MKLSSSLLQAIALGVSVTAVTAASTSCEKQDIKKKEQATDSRTNGSNNGNTMEGCPACGMG